MAEADNQNPEEKNKQEEENARNLRRVQMAEAKQKKAAAAASAGGKSTTKLAKQTASKMTLNIAFDSLATLYGSIPALLYLDFYYIKSTFFDSEGNLAKMNIGQKIILFLVNLLIFFIILIFLTIIAIVAKCAGSLTGLVGCLLELGT